MSRPEYQRAMADLLHSPGRTRPLFFEEPTRARGYDLTAQEVRRLRYVAEHRGLGLQCMLYRASRMVGIVRRLPESVALLNQHLTCLFDAYLRAHLDAPAEFDQEAQRFATFVLAELSTSHLPGLDGEKLRATLMREAARLG